MNVAGITDVWDMGIEAMSRNPLSHNKNSVVSVGLLRGNHVESNVAARCYQHHAATSHPSDTAERA
jgi:hypothetical protein